MIFIPSETVFIQLEGKTVLLNNTDTIWSFSLPAILLFLPLFSFQTWSFSKEFFFLFCYLFSPHNPPHPHTFPAWWFSLLFVICALFFLLSTSFALLPLSCTNSHCSPTAILFKSVLLYSLLEFWCLWRTGRLKGKKRVPLKYWCHCVPSNPVEFPNYKRALVPSKGRSQRLLAYVLQGTAFRGVRALSKADFSSLFLSQTQQGDLKDWSLFARQRLFPRLTFTLAPESLGNWNVFPWSHNTSFISLSDFKQFYANSPCSQK